MSQISRVKCLTTINRSTTWDAVNKFNDEVVIKQVIVFTVPHVKDETC